MNEKLIEKKLREGVKKMGGLALKFTSPSFSGVPDRIILMPGMRFFFVETKSTGKPLSQRQKVVFTVFESLGFNVELIDDEGKLSEFLKKLK